MIKSSVDARALGNLANLRSPKEVLKQKLISKKKEEKKEVKKEAADPRIIGLIVGALLGAKAGSRISDAMKATANKLGQASKVTGPVTGGAAGALLAHLITKGGDVSSEALSAADAMPPQTPQRKLTVRGASNVYGQPGYNPRY